MNPENLDIAFSGGTKKLPYSDSEIAFSVKELPQLVLKTGKIVACDPLVVPESEPFSLQVPSGVYPTNLAIAHIDDDQRVAYAKIEFSNSPIVKWKMATLPQQNLSSLKHGEIFGYGVDSGTGCFADQEAMKELLNKMKSVEDYYEEMIAQSDKTYVHTWSWASIEFQPNTECNLICFSSGWGDGLYASWIGYTSDGEIGALVTDFDVIYDETEDTESAGVNNKWWQFWK